MTQILSIIFFVFGLIIGSFLNVVILRYNTQKSFGGRSACMSCRSPLSWYELIPVVSFLLLRGKCHNCKTKISIQYPLVEFTTGLIFAFLFLKFKDIFFIDTFLFSVTYAYYATAFSLLVVIASYDLRHKIIPDMLAIFFGSLAFIGLFFFNSNSFLSVFYPHVPNFGEFISGPFIAMPFATVWFLSRGAWMGFGDAKLALGLGWLLGFSKALSALVFSFWSGAIIGLLLLFLSKKHGMKSEIPFAPFLVLGTLLAFLFEFHIFGGLF